MSEKAFLYQINFNRKKYPEICQALDDAKDDLGVAWYLRELIQKDIDEKRGRGVKPTIVETPLPEPKKEVPKKIDLPDDSGGFL